MIEAKVIDKPKAIISREGADLTPVDKGCSTWLLRSTRLFSLRQHKELHPRKVSDETRPNRWTNTWKLLPGKYAEATQHIRGDKHMCRFQCLVIDVEGRERTESWNGPIPLWIEGICPCIENRSFVADDPDPDDDPADFPELFPKVKK